MENAMFNKFNKIKEQSQNLTNIVKNENELRQMITEVDTTLGPLFGLDTRVNFLLKLIYLKHVNSLKNDKNSITNINVVDIALGKIIAPEIVCEYVCPINLGDSIHSCDLPNLSIKKELLKFVTNEMYLSQYLNLEMIQFKYQIQEEQFYLFIYVGNTRVCTLTFNYDKNKTVVNFWNELEFNKYGFESVEINNKDSLTFYTNIFAAN